LETLKLPSPKSLSIIVFKFEGGRFDATPRPRVPSSFPAPFEDRVQYKFRPKANSFEQSDHGSFAPQKTTLFLDSWWVRLGRGLKNFRKVFVCAGIKIDDESFIRPECRRYRIDWLLAPALR
jgi:hypothetical protein